MDESYEAEMYVKELKERDRLEKAKAKSFLDSLHRFPREAIFENPDKTLLIGKRQFSGEEKIEDLKDRIRVLEERAKVASKVFRPTKIQLYKRIELLTDELIDLRNSLDVNPENINYRDDMGDGGTSQDILS